MTPKETKIMNKKQINNATLTQRFFNEFTSKAMSNRSDVSTTMTQSVNLAFQFKAFDLLEERRVEIWVNTGAGSVLCVQIAKIEAGNSHLTGIREFVLANVNFDHVLTQCVEFFEKV